MATLVVCLTACGGGAGNTPADTTPNTDQQRLTAAMRPSNSADAYRFLMQATFGPTPDTVARVSDIGYANWIDEQFDLHLQTTHLDMVNLTSSTLAMDAPHSNDILYTWWTHALTDPAQLRQRVAFALSEIFVVSTMAQDNGRTMASYMDMLTDKADGNFRDLLEAVALHPAMGQYLSHLGNLKENPTTGRTPDENFAREIMQLFSIGLYELNDSGKPKLVNGSPVETYTADDIKGMARVFTGFSWNRPSSKSTLDWWLCFFRTNSCSDPSQDVSNMSAYKDAHATSVKQFLGVTIAAQTEPDPATSLRIALDRLASHPNTAPFISRQLIQRLVTSNPSDAYVSDITQVFRANNGNLKQVVKAILLHNEARKPADSTSYGKLREPVLRLTHLLRTIPIASITAIAQQNAGHTPFLMAADTSDAATALGQTPMRSPSVFNFFRPGYRPPHSALPADMVAPEMQITSETSMLGYANFMASILQNGWGMFKASGQKADIQFDFSQWYAKANNASELVDSLSAAMLGTSLADDVRTEAIDAIESMPADLDYQRRERIQAAILLIAISPSFIVQQ